MHALMFPMGSSGDVNPFVALGCELRSRGHSVEIVANDYFRGLVAGAGLEFTQAGTEREYLDTLRNPDLWKFGKTFRILFDKLLDGMEDVYWRIEAASKHRDLVVIAPSAAFGARIAQEKLGVRLVSLNVETNIFRTCEGHQVDPSVEASLPARLCRRAGFRLLDALLLDPALRPRMDAFRRTLGLAPVKRPLAGWIHSPDCLVGLFPDWFAPKQPDWPAHLKLTGFPLSDGRESPKLPAEAAAFLDNGPPAVVFTLGTAVRFAEQFFATSAEVCRRQKRRAIFISDFPDQIPRPLPPQILHMAWAPFSRLLPRVAALVHHGGIGTLSAALRAGIPQLITPFTMDQPHNARRVQLLGVGDTIRPSLYRPDAAQRALADLLDSSPLRARCKEIALRLDKSDAVARTADWVEQCMMPGLDTRRTRAAAE